MAALLAAGASAAELPWGAVGSARQSRVRPVIGTKGMVVSDSEQASQWGAEILRQGGNAIDAAVATAFMLAVTRPYYASIGGGGFLVYCPAPIHQKKQKCTTIDYREKAPEAAKRDMYIRNGKGDTDLSQNGPLASGVPGVPAGLLTALSRFGTMSRARVLRAPIEAARDGIHLSGLGEELAGVRWKYFNPAARAILGCGPRGKRAPCPVGTLIRQKDLARVLRAISDRGVDGFYRGWVAQKIEQGVRSAGGILSAHDLESYTAATRDPVQGEFEGYELVSMAPPSSGGELLAQMAGYVERAQKAGSFNQGFGSAESIHALAHAMALGFADRAKYLGDPDFYNVPLAKLLSPTYLDRRWKSFDAHHAHIPDGAGALEASEGTNTTHFSVIDSKGNAVAVTTTINDNFGSGFVPPGTGVFMNDEMDDFSIQPGVPNMFGLVGADADAIAPGKRPLSSMSPTIVRDRQGNNRIVIGGAGGSHIPTAVFDVLVNRLLFGMSLPDAMSAPRIHEQWKPATLVLERYGFSPDVRAKLSSMGYSIEEVAASARLHALERFPNGRVWGVPDPRGEGVAVAQ